MVCLLQVIAGSENLRELNFLKYEKPLVRLVLGVGCGLILVLFGEGKSTIKKPLGDGFHIIVWDIFPEKTKAIFRYMENGFLAQVFYL